MRIPRQPSGGLLLGNLPEFRRDMLGFLSRSAREYGDFVPLRFGPKRAFLLSHPDDIEHALVTGKHNFIKVSAKALLIACLLILLAGATIPVFKARSYQAVREKAVAAEAAVTAGKSLTDEQREARRAWAEINKRTSRRDGSD